MRLVIRWGLTLEDFDSPNLKQTFSASFPAGWKPSTCTVHLTRACAFGNWLARSHHTNQRHHLPAAYRKMKNRPVPTDAEVERLIQFLQSRASPGSGFQRTREQDVLICRVLYETGARITEAISINVDDIREHEDGHYLIINGTKSESAHRAVPISSELYADLKAFRLRWAVARGRLFRSKSGRPLIGDVWGRVLKSFCVQLGIHCTVTPHVFRYAYILREIAKGTSALELMTRLGHSDITMTVYYFNQVRRLMPFIEFNPDIALLEKKLQTRRHIWRER